MNLMKYPRAAYSINHFDRPSCHELAGKEYLFIMDSGYDYRLKFESGEFLCWSVDGREAKREAYHCHKADDMTYLVTFLEEGADPAAYHIYVIDTEQRLVTQLISRKGENPKLPLLVTPHFTFGAIEVEGYPLPLKRHCFTSENIGTQVRWDWGPGFYTKHYYAGVNYYRITWDDDGAAAADFDSFNEKMPSTDEKAWYVKIKDNMILFSLVEEMQERILGDKGVFRSNNLTMLQNYDRMFQVCCCFGATMINGEPKQIVTHMVGYGSPVELDESVTAGACPFNV